MELDPTFQLKQGSSLNRQRVRSEFQIVICSALAATLDATLIMGDATRIRSGSLAQIVDLVASFPKSGHMPETELRVKSYDRFKFGC